MSNGIFGKDNRQDGKNSRTRCPACWRNGPPTQCRPPLAPAPVAAPQQHDTATTRRRPAARDRRPNIKLKSAEISDCTRWSSRSCRRHRVQPGVVIAQTGTLSGTATIDNAEIRSEFGRTDGAQAAMICATGKSRQDRLRQAGDRRRGS
jgi:hypothetical protein